jgi:ribokinase
MARLAGTAHFFTALGDDEVGRRCFQRLSELGVTVHAAWRPEPQRRAVTFLDGQGERTITVIGPRLEPLSSDDLPWHLLDECRGCYFTAGSFAEARRAGCVVATTRARGVQPDVWIGSSADEREAVFGDLMGARLLVMTEGSRGGRYWTEEGAGSWEACALPGEPVDAYGCGDSFAAALAYGLGTGLSVASALEAAARCGAAVRCRRGPY